VRWQEGWDAGYTQGLRDGERQAAAAPSSGSPTISDLRWLLKRAHPDVAGADPAAQRVTSWLTGLLARTR